MGNHENYENADAPKSCRIVSTSKNSTFTIGSSTKDGRSLLTNVKGSKKVMISGPIINSDQRSEYKRYLDNEATKVGEVDEIDIVELPKMFLLPDVRTHKPNRV